MPETPGTHVQERLKRLLVRIGETLKQLRSGSVGGWWLVWVSGAWLWIWAMGSSKVANGEWAMFGRIRPEHKHRSISASTSSICQDNHIWGDTVQRAIAEDVSNTIIILSRYSIIFTIVKCYSIKV